MQARANRGKWLLRVEDIDPPREAPGAIDEILRVLDCYGFDWDGPASFQSDSRAEHEAAIEQLINDGVAYRCGCSRRDLKGFPSSPLGTIYPGTCRNGTQAKSTSVRVRTDDQPLVFQDLLQGEQRHRLESESGDFVVLRKDRLVAYQLAVAVDDYLQGITEVVRGIDLLGSTPRQIWVQKCLGYSTPGYAHIPVATNTDDQKLSKSHGALPVQCEAAAATLFAAFEFLEQEPPAELRNDTVEHLWQWAKSAWNIRKLCGKTQGLAAANLYQMPNSKARKNA